MVTAHTLHNKENRKTGTGSEYFCRQTYWKRLFSVQNSGNMNKSERAILEYLQSVCGQQQAPHEKLQGSL
jgi:hypothetical protein